MLVIKFKKKGENKMEFNKYQHIERFGTDEVENIEFGRCFIFYKIDGTNGQVYLDADGNIKAGSRNRVLTLENDNANFYQYVLQNERIKKYLEKHPNHRLYGEWLVPHSIKTYRKDAWRRFYIFDVALHKEDDTEEYIPYEIYQPLLEEFELDYIPPLAILKNPTEESLIRCLEKTGQFLVEDGKGNGEGIVIKNYDFYNKYGRQTWAKIVSNEFKEVHAKAMGADVVTQQQIIEEKIINKYCTEAFIEKEYAKIVNEKEGWRSQYIPMLLGRVFSELIKEETWNFIKEFKTDDTIVVVDPVMVATSGAKLIGDDAIDTLKESLFPLAAVLTPNIPEAEVLSGMKIKSADDMIAAAKWISETYHCEVLCKGGHQLNDANDLLYRDGGYRWFNGKRIHNSNTHGTGCTLSSAIASNLAKGYDLDTAVERAKAYISGALGAMLDLGKGSGPMDHGFDFRGKGFAEERV